MNSFAQNAVDFYLGLEINEKLPNGAGILNPYRNSNVQSIVRSFFNRYYNDRNQRVILLGINPGRFGAGITGITFTDPVRLEDECGISNSFEKRSELSSRFIYDLIQASGGVHEFFGNFFLSAVCPLGLIRSGRNLNYYDDRSIEDALEEFIVNTMEDQISLGVRRDVAVCLGEGKNMKYLQRLNREKQFFREILPLPHPRWVMQYRFKQKEEYVRVYLDTITSLQAPGK